MRRCRAAISTGWYPGVDTKPENTPGLHTRCMRDESPHTKHTGKGLAQFDYQRINWFEGDRRGYTTDRGDEHAWEL